MPLGSRVLAAHVGLLNPDRASLLLTLHLEDGQKVGLKVSRIVATQIAAEIARIEGCALVKVGHSTHRKGTEGSVP